MNRLLIAGLGVALLTLAGCATTGMTSSSPAAASAGVPWESDASTLPAIGPFEDAWTLDVDDSTLPTIDPVEPFSAYDPLPN